MRMAARGGRRAN